MNYLILLVSINLWSFNALPVDILTLVDEKSIFEQTKPCTFETESTKVMETSKTIQTAVTLDRDWRFKWKQIEYYDFEKCPTGYMISCNLPGNNCSSLLVGTCFQWPTDVINP